MRGLALIVAVVMAAGGAQAQSSGLVAACAASAGLTGPLVIENGTISGVASPRLAALNGVTEVQAAAVNTCVLRAQGFVATPVIGILADKPTVERRAGLLCRYPFRPSDTPFSGGSGYIIKDAVRAAQGCR